MEQIRSTSLQQLSPVTRLYIRRLLQQTFANTVQNQSPQTPQSGSTFAKLSSSSEEVDQALTAWLNQQGQGGQKLAELERLALLFQDLSSQGSTQRTQLMAQIEAQVTELLGPFQVAETSAPSLPVPPPPELPQPTESLRAEPIAPKPPAIASGPEPLAQPLTLYQHLTLLSAMSRVSQQYFGAPVIVHYWNSCRPKVAWLEQVHISWAGDFSTDLADLPLLPEQKGCLETWCDEYTKRCSRVVPNFESVLKVLRV